MLLISKQKNAAGFQLRKPAAFFRFRQHIYSPILVTALGVLQLPLPGIPSRMIRLTVFVSSPMKPSFKRKQRIRNLGLASGSSGRSLNVTRLCFCDASNSVRKKHDHASTASEFMPTRNQGKHIFSSSRTIGSPSAPSAKSSPTAMRISAALPATSFCRLSKAVSLMLPLLCPKNQPCVRLKCKKNI